ncbi:MAG: hypothetical protein M0Z54_12925 [Thermaerobacter sp.]|nr:hypothetical protein [Thermaerobacter sp.]
MHDEPDYTERPAAEVSGVATHLQTSVGHEYQQMMAYLMKSFMENHGRRMGLDMEERSIDEMRHMGWIAKQMGAMGLQPKFPAVDAGAGAVSGHARLGRRVPAHAGTDDRSDLGAGAVSREL